MNIVIKFVEDSVLLQLNGQLNIDTVNDFARAVQGAIAQQPKKLILDAKQLEYVSSAGIQAIYQAWHTVADYGGELVICQVREHVAKVFELINIESDMKVYRSITDVV